MAIGTGDAVACSEGRQVTVNGTIDILMPDPGSYWTILAEEDLAECEIALKGLGGVPPGCAEGRKFSATGRLQAALPGSDVFHLIVSRINCR